MSEAEDEWRREVAISLIPIEMEGVVSQQIDQSVQLGGVVTWWMSQMACAYRPSVCHSEGMCVESGQSSGQPELLCPITRNNRCPHIDMPVRPANVAIVARRSGKTTLVDAMLWQSERSSSATRSKRPASASWTPAILNERASHSRQEHRQSLSLATAQSPWPEGRHYRHPGHADFGGGLSTWSTASSHG